MSWPRVLSAAALCERMKGPNLSGSRMKNTGVLLSTMS
jgi:hypothetical protein